MLLLWHGTLATAIGNPIKSTGKKAVFSSRHRSDVGMVDSVGRTDKPGLVSFDADNDAHSDTDGNSALLGRIVDELSDQVLDRVRIWLYISNTATCKQSAQY